MKVLIIGATSAIAKAMARQLALQHATFFIVGRNPAKLAVLSEDLLIRGAKAVESYAYDFTEDHLHDVMLGKARNYLNTVDLILIAQGYLPDQTACQNDYRLVFKALSINAMSVIAQSTILANWLEQQGSGVLAVISSVAGERGRKSNYVYGSAKAAVSVFFEGLAHRFSKTDVKIMTIKPGLVDTPMTAQFTKGILWASPEKVSADILKAIQEKKRSCYTPWFWRWIMMIVRNIPNRLFSRIEF